jgi:hypothetical protein
VVEEHRCSSSSSSTHAAHGASGGLGWTISRSSSCLDREIGAQQQQKRSCTQALKAHACHKKQRHSDGCCAPHNYSCGSLTGAFSQGQNRPLPVVSKRPVLQRPLVHV